MSLTASMRPAGVFTFRFNSPMVLCRAASSACITTSTRPVKLQRTQQTSPMIQSSPILAIARYASTSQSAASTSNPSTSNASTTLTWNRFLTLRRTRRKISVVASSVSSLATTYVGLRFFIESGYDSQLATMLGLDPIITTGLSTMAFLAVGWLIGPFFGNAAFNMRYSSIRKQIQNKEREFYERIKRHRVDPTSSSMANPVPDYYGEKIGSVADYRRWLKDQRAFNLKRGAYLGTK